MTGVAPTKRAARVPVGTPGRAAEHERGLPAGRATPWVLAAAVIALQIAYPLVEGDVRDVVTIAVVATFAAASLAHAAVWRGVAFAAAVAAVAFGGGLLVEAVGVATGFPFGAYTYAGRLGPAVAGVPVIIPLAWTMMAYPSLLVGERIARRSLGVALAGGAALAAWDLFLDPQMVSEGHWTWAASGGPHLYGAIPLQNFVAWFVVGTAMAWVLHRAPRRDHPRPDSRVAIDDRAPLALYVWTWASSTLAHAAFFDLRGSAVLGGVVMGGVVVTLWLRVREPSRPRARG